MNKSKIQYYESIDTLWLYNFDQYMKTKNNNWFIVGFDGRQKIVENKYLVELEKRIQDEYFIAVDDNSFKRKLKTWAKIDMLQAKYNAILGLVQGFSAGFELTEESQKLRHDYIKLFHDWGFKRMPLLNSPSGDLEECEKILHTIGEIKTKIAIEKEKLQEDGKQETKKLQSQLRIAEITLDLGYKIKEKETTVLEWIEIGKLMIEKQKIQSN